MAPRTRRFRSRSAVGGRRRRMKGGAEDVDAPDMPESEAPVMGGEDADADAVQAGGGYFTNSGYDSRPQGSGMLGWMADRGRDFGNRMRGTTNYNPGVPVQPQFQQVGPQGSNMPGAPYQNTGNSGASFQQQMRGGRRAHASHKRRSSKKRSSKKRSSKRRSHKRRGKKSRK